jgi:small conductance mechanosensitive channel
MENVTQTLLDFATTYGLKVVAAILILIVGRIVAGWARKLVVRLMKKSEVDQAIQGFVRGLVYYLIIIFTWIAVLNKFGVETASLVAVLGMAGFAVGFALQGSLSNFAAGIMLLVFRPFKIGDYVDIAGTSGSVTDLQLFVTIMNTPDNIRIIVPNGQVFGSIIKNYSAEDTRRVDFVVGIGYGSDMKKAEQVMRDIVTADSRVLKDPEPQIAVAELADSSVNFVLRPWVKKEDYWAVKFDVTEKIKERFDAEGIEIPFPQMVMHKGEA